MRYLISLAVSCVVVFFLFLGMNKLITPDHRELVEKEDVSMTDFIRIKPQETLQERQRELPKPPPRTGPLPSRDGSGQHGSAADGELADGHAQTRHPGQHRWRQRPRCL